MYEGGRAKSLDTFVASAALHQVLFNQRTCPRDQTTIHIDTLKDWHVKDVGESYEMKECENVEKDERKGGNIICTFDIINLIGWKYSQDKTQMPKERGTAEFSLKDIADSG